jgi:plastocyanin
MKTIYTKALVALLITFAGLSANATTWTVNVANNVFQNNPTNVMVGDVIHWVWFEGSHTTTSTSVPSGANTWDAMINSSNTTFDYTVTTPGTYAYHCSFHPGMTGSFVATSISTTVSPTLFENAFEVSMDANSVTASYNVSSLSRVTIALYDLTGKMVKRLSSTEAGPGLHTEEFPVSDVTPGMYFVVADIGAKRNTQRIIVR